MIDDLGGADVCYGGIGWCGHIAFWEAHLGFEFKGDLAAFKKAGPRLVELHPMTIMQNALHSFGGDWSWVPPKANTIGPQQILGARDRSFWLDGALGAGISWQRFIARLVAHGPVTPLVPGSILQESKGQLHDSWTRCRQSGNTHGLATPQPTSPHSSGSGLNECSCGFYSRHVNAILGDEAFIGDRPSATDHTRTKP
jgi:hypothetical protein